MALKTLPVRTDSPDYKFTIDLDGVIYGFRFVLNTRTGRWTMFLTDEVGNEIISGIAVVTNWLLLDNFSDPRLPKGTLFTCDTTGGEDEPDEFNFGNTILLMYDEATT